MPDATGSDDAGSAGTSASGSDASSSGASEGGPATPPGCESAAVIGRAVQVSEGPSLLPAAAGFECAVHAVWLQGSELVHRASSDGGAEWSSEHSLASGLQNYGVRPGIAANGDVLVAIWAADTIDDAPQLWTAHSENEGESWSTPEELGKGRSPAVLINQAGSRYALWTDNGIQCREYDSAWSPAQTVLDLPDGWNNLDAVVAGTAIHVALWTLTPDGTRQVRYMRSSQGCENWTDAIPLAEPLEIPGPGQYIGEPHPAIAASEQRVAVVWSDVPHGDAPEMEAKYVYVRTSSNGGQSFEDAVRLDPSPGTAVTIGSKDVAVAGSTIRVLTSAGQFATAPDGTWSAVNPNQAGDVLATGNDWTGVVGLDGATLQFMRIE